MNWVPALAAALAAVGAYLLYTSSTRPARRTVSPVATAERARVWMDQAGLTSVSPREAATAIGSVVVAACALGWVVFGSAIPALTTGLLAAGLPISAYRSRRQARLDAASDHWPRLLEDIRLRTGALGRSVPQALFEAGRHGPVEWRPAFAAAEREWLLTTDFTRTVSLLKARLSDATADAVCETLVVAHDLGGTDLDRRLSDLIDDRREDLEHRRDASARQAGVRFARRFVLLVPLGMALAGLAIGNGRSAYTTAGGQLAVVVALVGVAGCWMWSGRLMRLPPAPRVFR